MTARHTHRCPCGDYYVCSQPPDRCPRDWTCPACETEQMDDYYRQLTASQPTPQPKETRS